MTRFVKQGLTVKYIAILLAALVMMPGESTAAEEWHCWGSIFAKSNAPLVKLHQEDDKRSGSVEVFGETHSARVDIVGLNKIWVFGEESTFAIVVQPNGRMFYYESLLDDKAKPSMTFYCALEQPSAETHRFTEEEQKRKEAGLKEKLQAEETQRRLSSLQEANKLAILQKVRRNWIRPLGSEKVPECWVRVIQGPGGIILDVTFGTCKGSTLTYRASIESAVYKAEPLPKPGDPSLFERELNFNFKPE